MRFISPLVWISFIFSMIFSVSVVRAEPYLAVKAGATCSRCHVSPTGGGKRNEFGAVFGQTAASANQPPSIWSGDPVERISLGADLRANFLSTSIPNQTDQLAFELEEALLYGEVELIKDRVSFYLDQRVSPGAALSREAYGLFKSGNGDYYAKFGRFFLPHGFRLEDDTAFVRQATGFNFNNPDTGIELGIDRDNFTANLAISNGAPGSAETDTGKQFSFRTSFVENSWRLGGSLSFNDSDAANRTTGGLFGAIRTGFIQWLGEFAFIRDDLDSGEDREQFALFTEANIGWRQGHNIKLTYEHLDPDQDIDENEQNRFSTVYEYFPIQFVQLIGGLRIRDGIPQIDNQNTNEAFVQMHLYF